MNNSINTGLYNKSKVVPRILTPFAELSAKGVFSFATSYASNHISTHEFVQVDPYMISD